MTENELFGNSEQLEKDHFADPGNMVGDLISRQAAIDATWEEPSYTDPLNVLTEVRDRIKALPPAQPERIKGHWIDAVIPNDSGGLPVIVCDKCNTFFPLQFGASHNFCPNCGADMRGEQDG